MLKTEVKLVTEDLMSQHGDYDLVAAGVCITVMVGPSFFLFPHMLFSFPSV
jgi:hypothetical protein